MRIESACMVIIVYPHSPDVVAMLLTSQTFVMGEPRYSGFSLLLLFTTLRCSLDISQYSIIF